MASKKALIVGSSDSESDSEGFHVNQAYAEKYDNWRKREEYQRLKDKYGEGVLSEASGISESDSDSDQDSDPEEQAALLSGDIFDYEFLRVYKALKQNDPIIFDTSVKLYTDGQTPSSSSLKKKTAVPDKMNLMDYHLKLMKERQGVTEEDDSNAHACPGYYEELSNIVNDLKAALSGDEDDEQLLKSKPRKAPETRAKSTKSVVDLGEPQNETDRFLQQFILNKPYKQDTPFAAEATSSATVPGDSHEPEAEHSDDEPDPSPDTSHRFEEAGGSEIRRYPRTLSSARDLLVREEKAAKRKDAKERKRSEKSEDLKRFTDLHRQEMAQKLSKLQQTSGNERFLDTVTNGFAFQSLVDDELFDPEKHDQKMSQLFGTDYYDSNADGKKPVFEFIEGIDEDGEDDADKIAHYNGPIVDPDADEDEAEEEEEEEEEDGDSVAHKLSRKEKKQRKRRVKKLDVSRIPDYDDVVGGLPVRFKYCTVTPNDFGLSPEEILFSDEKELNAWASLKKTVSFRDEHEEQTDVLRYNSKRGDWRHKQKILKSFFKDTSDEPVAKKTKKRKRRSKNKLMLPNEAAGQSDPCVEADNATAEEAASEEAILLTDLPSGKEAVKPGKRKRTRGKRHVQRGVDEERLRAYGFSKSDMKRKKLL